MIDHESNLGERILFARKELSLTQQELAEKCGVTRVAVTRWETNKATPIYHVSVLASSLNVSTEWLLKGYPVSENDLRLDRRLAVKILGQNPDDYEEAIELDDDDRKMMETTRLNLAIEEMDSLIKRFKSPIALIMTILAQSGMNEDSVMRVVASIREEIEKTRNPDHFPRKKN
jgi:transcriptional regulator with XRE-family HTH domain